jgi:hypothetical protein
MGLDSRSSHKFQKPMYSSLFVKKTSAQSRITANNCGIMIAGHSGGRGLEKFHTVPTLPRITSAAGDSGAYLRFYLE